MKKSIKEYKLNLKIEQEIIESMRELANKNNRTLAGEVRHAIKNYLLSNNINK